MVLTEYNVMNCAECYLRHDSTHADLTHKLKKLHELECRKLGVDHKSADEKYRLAQAKNDIKESFTADDGAFIDIYSSAKRISQTKQVRLAKHPLQPSIDAVFPIAISSIAGKATLRYHVAGNIRPTALYLNYLKHTYSPRIITLMSKFLQHRYAANQGMDDITKAGFITAFDNLHLVGLKIPYIKTQRLGKCLIIRRYAN